MMFCCFALFCFVWLFRFYEFDQLIFDIGKLKFGSASMLEELHGALMLLRRCQGIEGSKIPAFTGVWIPLARIEPIFPRLEFPDHGSVAALLVRAALRAAADNPAGVFVWRALRAEIERSLTVRLAALRWVCREMASREPELRPSCFRARRTARERLLDGRFAGRVWPCS